MFIKRATLTNVRPAVINNKNKTAQALSGFDFEPEKEEGYLYVTARALTSDIPNLNFDMFPHEEMKTAYKTFIGCPVYVEHANTDLDRARGVILDAQYHDENPDDRWTEILMEMDEKTFPKLCSLIRSGELDTMSMGCSVTQSQCSVCGNIAEDMSDFCEHIQNKGAMYNGEPSFEICGGIEFIEESWVYVPADPNAMTTDKIAKKGKTANIIEDFKEVVEMPRFSEEVEYEGLIFVYDYDNGILRCINSPLELVDELEVKNSDFQTNPTWWIKQLAREINWNLENGKIARS